MIPQKFSLSSLCNTDKNAKIKFSVHLALNGNEINSVTCSVNDLSSSKDPAGRSEHKANAGATFIVRSFSVRVMPNFVDYLRSGWGVSMCCAIDYTGSNGNPSLPSSLHYLGPNNQYQNAISSVGSIIEPYDSDRVFQVFGFGGIPKHMGLNQVSHCFALNGNPAAPGIFTVAGIIEAYRGTQKSIELGGPTLFNPLLNEFYNLCASMKGT